MKNVDNNEDHLSFKKIDSIVRLCKGQEFLVVVFFWFICLFVDIWQWAWYNLTHSLET